MKSRGSMKNAEKYGETTPPIPSSTEASSLNYGSEHNAKDPQLFHSLKHKLQQHQHQGTDGASAASTSVTSAPSETSQVDGSSESLGPRRDENGGTGSHNLPQRKLPMPMGATMENIPNRPRSVQRPLQLPEPKLGVEEERKKVRAALRQAWITVSGLYRRAGYVDDAEMAITEASSLVEEGAGEGDILAEKGYLMLARSKKPLATQFFEAAISIDVDHAQGILGLSQLLLDNPINLANPVQHLSRPPSQQTEVSTAKTEAAEIADETNEEAMLDRLAATNRALGLLEKLVATAHGWDIAEAWLLLSDALEKAGEVGRAKDALWRVVELEDGTGVRRWGSVGMRVI